MALDRQSQVELLLEHYRQPIGSGKLADVDVVMPGGNPGCGDVVTIYLKVDRGDGSGDSAQRAGEVRFVGSGCTISQAASSILMEMMDEEHPPLDAILDMDYQVFMDTLGRDAVATRPRCATLALGTLKAAVRKFRQDERRRAAGLPVEQVPENELDRFEL